MAEIASSTQSRSRGLCTEPIRRNGESLSIDKYVKAYLKFLETIEHLVASVIGIFDKMRPKISFGSVDNMSSSSSSCGRVDTLSFKTLNALLEFELCVSITDERCPKQPSDLARAVKETLRSCSWCLKAHALLYTVHR